MRKLAALILFVLGISLIALSLFAMGGEAEVSFGGCVMVFFIPICFSAGREPALMLAIALLALASFLLVALLLISYLRALSAGAEDIST